MREIMLVPFPLTRSRDLISFFTFQISTFLSACSAVTVVSFFPSNLFYLIIFFLFLCRN